MNKKLYLYLIFSFLITLSGLFILGTTYYNFSSVNKDYKKGNLIIANQKINIDIADNNELRYLGLSGRDRLNTDSGMLFVFGNSDYQIFCMRGMKFPIDILWIRDSKIIGFQENMVVDNGAKNYSSPEPINYVLEINAGFVKDNYVSIGDPISIEL